MKMLSSARQSNAVIASNSEPVFSRIQHRANIAGHIQVNQASSLPTPGVLILGFSLAVLQAMDGILTSVGVSRYGPAIEGNPLLRALIEEYGHTPTLALTKIFAIFVVIALTFMADGIPWVKKALGALTCVYLFGAVLPWTYILFLQT